MPEIGIKVDLDSTGAITGLREVNREIASAARAGKRDLAGLEKGFKGLGSTISGLKANIGLVLVGAVAATGAAFVSATADAAQYEKQIAEIQTISDTTVFSQQKIRDINLEIASTYGSDVRENAKALYQTISAGVTDAAGATKLLEAASQLSIGGVTELTTSVDLLTSVTNAYAAKGLTAADATDSLFTAIRTGKTDAGALAASLGKVAPIASQVGLEFSELSATTAALTLTTGNTSEAVTQIRSLLVGVIKETPKAQKVAKELGVEFNIAALRAKGLAGFLDDLVVQSGASEKQLQELFGRVEAVSGALALTANNSKDLTAALAAQSERTGEGARAFQRMTETLAFQQDRFDSLSAAARLSIGTVAAESEGARGSLKDFNDTLEAGIMAFESETSKSIIEGYFTIIATGAGTAADVLSGGILPQLRLINKEAKALIADVKEFSVDTNTAAGKFKTTRFAPKGPLPSGAEPGKTPGGSDGGRFSDIGDVGPARVDEIIASLEGLADANLALEGQLAFTGDVLTQEEQQQRARSDAFIAGLEARAKYNKGLAQLKREEGELLRSTAPVEEQQLAATKQLAADMVGAFASLAAGAAEAAGSGASAGEVMRGFLGGIVQSIGSMLVQLGTAAITAGILGSSVPILAGITGGPAGIAAGGVALAAGIGMIAAGAAIKGGGTPSGSSGGSVSAGVGGSSSAPPTPTTAGQSFTTQFDTRSRDRRSDNREVHVHFNQPVGNPRKAASVVRDMVENADRGIVGGRG